ncbi:unnamed protein product [marine sediment metagenome]|uniref:Uncharacterized protein n=1 Tax=marine sediment metagenome TaxID=412755 RepID=X0SJ38_9ZZZZ
MREHAMTVIDAASLMLERLLFRVTLGFSVCAWAALAYALLTCEWIAVPGGSLPYKHPDLPTILGLLCGVVSSACSAYYVKLNIDRLRAWLFAAWCFLAFFGLVSLLEGFGVAEAG